MHEWCAGLALTRLFDLLRVGDLQYQSWTGWVTPARCLLWLLPTYGGREGGCATYLAVQRIVKPRQTTIVFIEVCTNNINVPLHFFLGFFSFERVRTGERARIWMY